MKNITLSVCHKWHHDALSTHFFFYRLVPVLLSAVMYAGTAAANPRTKSTIRQAAAEVLNPTSPDGSRRAPRKDKLVELQSNYAITVMGYQSGGYAIIGNDDRLPLVIGYSDNVFDTKDNPGLKWFLESIKIDSVAPANAPSKPKLHTAVPNLLKTDWGQAAPYNNMCPVMNSRGERAVTGCVATAMAQIIVAKRYPMVGRGVGTLVVKREDSQEKDTITIDFSKSHYNYDNMPRTLSYSSSQKEINEVAKFMLDLGVAFKMDYGTAASGGSGATEGNALEGLKKYFGFPNSMQGKSRANYSTADWMKMIYDDLASGNPIFYTGRDTKANVAHAFVLDGYNNDGYILINWGSGGGYYNLESSSISYSSGQYMINFPKVYTDSLAFDTVTVKTPGTLQSIITDSEKDKVSGLKVSGKINSDDLRFIRAMAGLNEDGFTTNANLAYLDLRDADIVSGGSPYLYTETKPEGYVTEDNKLPDYAFYGSPTLKKIILPESLTSIGYSALYTANAPDSVCFGHNFPAIDGGIYNADTTELVSVYKNGSGEFRILKSATTIREHAFRGTSFTGARLYKNITDINDYAFSDNDNKITKVWIYNPEIMAFGNSPFKKSQTVYLPINGDLKNGQNLFSKGISDTRNFGFQLGFDYKEDPYGDIYNRRYGEDNSTVKFSVITYNIPSADSADVTRRILASIRITLPPTATAGTYKGAVVLEGDTSFVEEWPFVNYTDKFIIEKNEAEIYLDKDNIVLNPGPAPDTFPYYFKGLQNGETDIPDSDWYDKPEFEVRDNYNKLVKNIEPGRYYYILFGNIPSGKNYSLNIRNDYTKVKASTTTGISGIQMSNGSTSNVGDIYNLSGQKVSDSYKGVVIINGKKYIRR